MRPLLLLVDLQQDYLRHPDLAAPSLLIAHAAALLNGFRARGLPIAHSWTTVRRSVDDRMPHWKKQEKWTCEEGTPGHQPPGDLKPLAGEAVFHKTFFSAFADPALHELLVHERTDTLILAGVHLHACIRATALNAYTRGLSVWIAKEAVGSYDPLHAALTQHYVQDRTILFMSAATISHHIDLQTKPPEDPLPLRHLSPRQPTVAWDIPIDNAGFIAETVDAARVAQTTLKRTPPAIRAGFLERLADHLETDAQDLPVHLAEVIGKPISAARGEVTGTIAMLRAVAARVDQVPDPDAQPVRRVPLGVVALITPWNNPLFIPLGKLAPALLFGNTVVWKPAPAGYPTAARVMKMLADIGLPEGMVHLVGGDVAASRSLMEQPGVAAVTITGSEQAGFAARALCAQRHIPLQAELGGNNAAIVWHDADLPATAKAIVSGAFGMAGQRCTATRRAIVDAVCYDDFLDLLKQEMAALVWGDPLDSTTEVGPLISLAHLHRVALFLDQAQAAGHCTYTIPRQHPTDVPEDAPYYPPTLVACDDPSHDIVQEEMFGPVLVVQRADDWDHAIRLCNGVRQGLAAALFSTSEVRKAAFLDRVQAGVLKLNQSTAGAAIDRPFGGWKASGIGPPEHGDSDLDFYTRVQAIYV